MFCKQTILTINQRIRTSKIAVRLASGAFWSVLGNALGRGLVLIAFIIVARLIGQNKYGELSMIRSTLLMFSVFSGAGLGLTASRYIALHRNTDKQKMYEVYLLSRYFSIGLGFLIALLLCIFAPLIAARSLYTPKLAIDIRYGALALFFITISSVQTGVLQGFEKFKIIAINTIFFGIIQLLCLSLGAFLYGTRGVVLGMGLSYFLLCLFNQIFIQQNIKDSSGKHRSRRINKDTFSILWKFSLPAVMSSILVIPVIWWCKTMLIKLNGFEAIANYDVAEQWSVIILFIPTTLAGIIIPLLSNTLSEGTTTQYKKLINVNLIANTLITVLISFCIVLFSSLILKFYGTAFNDIRTFSVLVLSTIPNAVAAVLGNIIASRGKMWIGFVLNFIWASWLILFFLFFAVKINYGAFGFALAMLVAYTLHVILSYTYMRVRVINNKDNFLEETV